MKDRNLYCRFLSSVVLCFLALFVWLRIWLEHITTLLLIGVVAKSVGEQVPTLAFQLELY